MGEPPPEEDEYKDAPMARMLLAPEEPIDTRQRVLRICLGAEHGILLTDAGVACTWGDNRYGQLGRRPCRKEEDDQPFPVLQLQNEEISQVAAGRHHCLALTAAGLVWAWGRNKAGQLGCGDNRDKVFPERVCHVQDGGEGAGLQLGSPKPDRRAAIISISAGNNSSLAAAMNSDVWQWGDISSDFQKRDKAAKGRSGSQHTHSARKQDVVSNRPFLVFEAGAYRSNMRETERVSISEEGCRVLTKQDMNHEARSRLKDMVESVRQLQESINKERQEIAEFEERLAARSKETKNAGEGDMNEQRNLQETIAMIELEISTCDRDIDLLKKNKESCEMQQAHTRTQLQSLMQQGTRLSNKQDEHSAQVLLAQRGTTDRSKKEEKLSQVKEFVEANQNTRMTLLDQLAETDKEKQRISADLERKKDRREQIKRRLDTVRDLGKSANESSGSSDKAMKFLKDRQAEITHHFQGRQPENVFVEAKKAVEMDKQFLSTLEEQGKVMVSSTPSATTARAQKVQLLLQDIIDLRGKFMTAQEERWLSEDLDMSSFFNKPKDRNQDEEQDGRNQDPAPEADPNRV